MWAGVIYLRNYSGSPALCHCISLQSLSLSRHFTDRAPPLHRQSKVTAPLFCATTEQPLHHHCTTAPPLHRHCTTTAPPQHHHCTATASPLHRHCSSSEVHRQLWGQVYKLASHISEQAFVTIRSYDAVHSHPGEEDLLSGHTSFVVTRPHILKYHNFLEDCADN